MSRVPHFRSIRLRAALVVLAVVSAAAALVALAALEERTVAGRMLDNVREGAAEAAMDPTAENVAEIARRRDVRVRVLSSSGHTVMAFDHQAGASPLAALSVMFYGDDGAPTPRAFDATLGKLRDRPEIRRATLDDTVAECRASDGAKLLLCSAARRADVLGLERVVYVQESSRRPVRAMHDLRYEVAKMVVLALPVAALLAWWLARRAAAARAS